MMWLDDTLYYALIVDLCKLMKFKLTKKIKKKEHYKRTHNNLYRSDNVLSTHN
jgi:hypothetical protein